MHVKADLWRHQCSCSLKPKGNESKSIGHNNYTKCCRLYLKDMCVCLKKPLEEGAFTIHRNEKLFWSGTWTGMTIEQSLMRSGKTHDGLVNITHKESARTKRLLTAHIVAQLCLFQVFRLRVTTFAIAIRASERQLILLDIFQSMAYSHTAELKTAANYGANFTRRDY